MFRSFALESNERFERSGEHGLAFLFTNTRRLRIVNQAFTSGFNLGAQSHLKEFDVIDSTFMMPGFTTATSPIKLTKARIRLATVSIDVRLFDLEEAEELDVQLSSYIRAVC